jgi:hypothetical protein
MKKSSEAGEQGGQRKNRGQERWWEEPVLSLFLAQLALGEALGEALGDALGEALGEASDSWKFLVTLSP